MLSPNPAVAQNRSRIHYIGFDGIFVLQPFLVEMQPFLVEMQPFLVEMQPFLLEMSMKATFRCFVSILVPVVVCFL